jgi:lipopolysaccharide/colanic/teichoic acid biosynthesis glycosyltransferase
VVTPFGKFLRKTRIDELPQCLNLLKGDVSLIGPRADIIGVHTDMSENVLNYKLRLTVPQGLTGWAQVHMNFPPRTHEEHRERLAYELFYIKNRSILLDISIILKTIKTLLSREGA